MKNKNNWIGFGMIAGIAILMSNASGVPQAVTKAPGEANHNSCATCHDVAGSYNPSISLDVMKTDSTIITHYTPGETYIVRVKVSGTNNPRAYGFQMAALDAGTNSDQGVWSTFGDKVKQQTLVVGGKTRKYLVQSSASASGIFTANWKAPSSDLGNIRFYFTGLAVNLNGNTNGDNNIFSNLTLSGPSTSSATILQEDLTPKIYPNPVTDVLTVDADRISAAAMIHISSNRHFDVKLMDGKINISHLPSGVYVLVLKNVSEKIYATHRIVKI